MKSIYYTQRLTLKELTGNDAEFMLELLNTTGWLKFIGDRKIKNKADAENYIQKIITNPAINYRVVTLSNNQTAIGIVTLIKRAYLDHPDIGFAFHPAYSKQGYAFEATNEVLNDIVNLSGYSTILATTVKENSSSIKLLIKLGFSFSKELTNNNELLQLFTLQKIKLPNPD